MEMRKLVRNFSGPKAVTMAMWAAVLIFALFVGLAIFTSQGV